MATALALALVAGVSALVGVSSKAYAVNSNISGTMCRYELGGQPSDIEYNSFGVFNQSSTNSEWVICPIVRSPTATNNAVNVYVDGWANQGYSVFCNLSSYNFDGTFLAVTSFTTSLPGNFDQYLTAAGSYWGAAAVECLLPPIHNGGIYDIDIVQ
jgi:hypothetical protein